MKKNAAAAALLLMSALFGELAAQTRQQPVLGAGGAEMGRLLGLEPLIAELERTPAEAGPTATVARLSARLQLTEGILAASLDADGVLAELDNEIAQTNEVRSYLEARRDHRIAINTVANIVTSAGVGVVGQLIQLRNSTLGNSLGAAAGGVSGVLSAIAMRQQHGGKRSLGIAPNMLAKLFDRQPEFHSDYPEVVWTYLNSAPPGAPTAETRRAALIREWTQVGRLDPPAQPKASRKVDQLVTSISNQSGLGIDALADRATMLADVRARVSLMKRDLGHLLRYVRQLEAMPR